MSDEPATSEPFDRRRAANALGLLLLLAVVGVFVAVSFPQAVGADESYVVLSDSMSPAIDAGSVVFVRSVPTEEIAARDVITFRDGADAGGSSRVTHRVVEVVDDDGQRQFRTKGDANEDPDPTLVSPSAVVGVVAFSVPYVGHVVAFAQTRLGLLALVVVPAVLLLVSELWGLYNAAVETEDEQSDAGGVDEP